MTLSACDSSYYAWDVSAGDLVGSWRSPGEIGTELILAEDGTFQATSWPTSLNCTGAMAEDMEELEAAPTSDLTGTWISDEGQGNNKEGGSLASLTLRFEQTCTQQSPTAYFTSADDGTLSMCFPLDRDPDSFTKSRALALLKTPSTEDAEAQACR